MKHEKLGAAYFFVAPALIYGIFTSRLPNLKMAAGINDGQVGILLLCLGLATLVGLAACGFVIDRLGPKKILALSIPAMFAAITLACAFPNLWLISLFCLFAGIAVGFCDVAMNAQGICIEKYNKEYCLSLLHGCSSLGGVIGSLSGSLFAYLSLSPFWNMAAILALFLCLYPMSLRNMSDFNDKEAGHCEKIKWRKISFFVYLCGILGLFCHIAEGSAGEWGSILLHGVKGASQGEAGLVFAAFTGGMVASRFGADRLRRFISDTHILFWGALIGAAGMALALISSCPWICLGGYAIMGAGLAPIVPILFSRAGADSTVTPGQASGIVSIFSYVGLLVFPPFLGMLGHAIGLEKALWLIVALCAGLAPACLATGTGKKNTAH